MARNSAPQTQRTRRSRRWRSREARRRWEEFAPASGEVVTTSDAQRLGLPLNWYRHFVEDHFHGREVRAEQLRFAIDDPSIRDLLRYKIEQRRLVDDLADVLDEELSAYDAVAAGVADPALVAVVREAFPDRLDVRVRELVPEASQPAVRELLFGVDGRPSAPRVRRARVRAHSRRAEAQALGDVSSRSIDIDTAIAVGAADASLRPLARQWFGESRTLRVEQLLLASHVPAFERLLGWQRMMSQPGSSPAS